MGELDVRGVADEGQARQFTRAVLRDLQALELLLERGLVESGRRRYGVEQEMFLVDDRGAPAPVAEQVLSRIDDPRFTTELARFNLEANLPPGELEGDFLERMHKQLSNAVRVADDTARSLGARILLIGILPTLRVSHLTIDNMSPVPRYLELNRSALRLKGGRSFTIFIRGLEVFEESFDNVMAEAANTSLQLHYQVEPENFAREYNAAQLISPALLAAASNSPVFCGRKLWHETRVAVFERAVDARSEIETARGSQPRVSFGYDWVRGSVLELFRENITRYRVMLTQESPADPIEQIESGVVPSLGAMGLHNGTIWRWNRPCFGSDGEQGHLRIENRVLPAGPTVLDEVANAAFFYGLMTEVPRRYGDPAEQLSFSAVRNGFISAARQGLDAQVAWIDSHRKDARTLILEDLLPMAYRGLDSVGVSSEHQSLYLGTFENRVKSGMTGSRWFFEMLRSVEGNRLDAMAKLTRRLVENQGSGEPVHRWPLARGSSRPAAEIAEIMTRNLFTVRPEDVIDLASAMMEWQHIRHIPVENDRGEVLGILSPRSWPRLLSRAVDDLGTVAVSDVMDTPPPCVSPHTTVASALGQLLESGHGCLLVVEQSRVVGIVTERDFLEAMVAETEAGDFSEGLPGDSAGVAST